MTNIRFYKVWLWGIFLNPLLLGMFLFGNSPKAAMNENSIRAAVEAKYDVKVLSVERDDRDGSKLFRVKVMYKGGDWNTAFQVNTLVIDGNTGKMVLQFQHKSSGRSLAETQDVVPNRQRPDALRGYVWK